VNELSITRLSMRFVHWSGVFVLALSCVSLEANEWLPGGEASTHKSGANAFSMPSSNMSVMRRLDFSVGNSFFRNPWVVAPASTDARDGLGPLFNTNSCQSCHIKDGRGHAPENHLDTADSLLVRLSVPAETKLHHKLLITSGAIPEPNYGGQVHDRAIPGVTPEARVDVYWTEKTIKFADGDTHVLRQPEYRLSQLGYGALHPNTMMSVRVAPPMIGLGLLEVIPREAILAKEDILDEDGDGISGKANRVWDVQKQSTEIGRFGWKAGQPNLMQQNAAAFNNDLGIKSTLFVEEPCTKVQAECQSAPSGGTVEVSDKILRFVEFYTRNLAVPARENKDDLQVEHGKVLFHEVGCAACHTPSYQTPMLANQLEQSNQTIWPYTDLLLHDMGEELADYRPEFLADGREWRTPPLWGLHAQEQVNGHTQLLHDARARNVLEAILWHGGEAQASQDKFRALNRKDRSALVHFVESL